MSRSHLNRAQKRALRIKDELMCLDMTHLDTFIEGTANIEPPRYEKINGIIQPPLQTVKLKEGANVLDLGNVFYPKDERIFHVTITVDKGSSITKRSEPLREEEGNFLSFPMHQAITKDLKPLWEAKYQRIVERRDKINEVRQFAHGLLNQPVRLSINGKAPGSQNSGHTDFDDKSKNGTYSRKRVSGEPVQRHECNKRARIGLASIPDSAKINTFPIIQDKFKIDLFDAIVKAAFPGFDNVMMAAWNVVSIYQNVGSDFPEVHRAIIELKSVLREFEVAHGEQNVKAAPHEKTLEQNETVPPNGLGGEKSTPEKAHESLSKVTQAGHSTLETPPLPQNEIVAKPNTSAALRKDVQQMVPPASRNGEKSPSKDARSVPFDFARMLEIHAANTRYTPARQGRRSEESPSNATLKEPYEGTVYDHLQKLRQQDGPPSKSGRGGESEATSKGLSEASVSGEKQVWKHEERGVSGYDVLKHQQQYSSSNKNDRSGFDIARSMREDSREKSNEGINDLGDELDPSIRHDPRKEKPQPAQPAFFGASRLGAPKKSTAKGTGVAPIAPMMHNTKDMNGFDRRRP